MNGIFWGICLIFVGIGLIGKFTGLFNILFNGWWTLFIILPATIDLFTKRHKFGSLCVIAVGVTLLLQQLNVINTGMIWKVLLASFIVIIGISMIFFRNKNPNVYIPAEIVTSDSENYAAIFGGQQRKFVNEKFTGANLTATFGGIELDLKEAIIENDVVINVSATFGGCVITVPSNVNIKTSGSNILGGVSNKISYENPDAPTIYIKSNAVCGGVEIK